MDKNIERVLEILRSLKHSDIDIKIEEKFEYQKMDFPLPLVKSMELKQFNYALEVAEEVIKREFS